MVDPISNAPNSRQIGPAQNRSQASSDDSQGDVDWQWPPAELRKLRHYLRQMDGLLLDTEI
jgi:hypothetical protein